MSRLIMLLTLGLVLVSFDSSLAYDPYAHADEVGFVEFAPNLGSGGFQSSKRWGGAYDYKYENGKDRALHSHPITGAQYTINDQGLATYYDRPTASSVPPDANPYVRERQYAQLAQTLPPPPVASPVAPAQPHTPPPTKSTRPPIAPQPRKQTPVVTRQTLPAPARQQPVRINTQTPVTRPTLPPPPAQTTIQQPTQQQQAVTPLPSQQQPTHRPRRSQRRQTVDQSFCFPYNYQGGYSSYRPSRYSQTHVQPLATGWDPSQGLPDAWEDDQGELKELNRELDLVIYSLYLEPPEMMENEKGEVSKERETRLVKVKTIYSNRIYLVVNRTDATVGFHLCYENDGKALLDVRKLKTGTVFTEGHISIRPHRLEDGSTQKYTIPADQNDELELEEVDNSVAINAVF